jgi:hypothetical protein
MGKRAHLVLPLFTLLSMGMSLSTETTKPFFDENHLSTKPFFDENHLSEVVQVSWYSPKTTNYSLSLYHFFVE